LGWTLIFVLVIVSHDFEVGRNVSCYFAKSRPSVPYEANLFVVSLSAVVFLGQVSCCIWVLIFFRFSFFG